MSDVLFDPSNSYLLECHIHVVQNPFPETFKDEIDIELIFENHSGIPGDVLHLRIQREDFQNFKNVLITALVEE